MTVMSHSRNHSRAYISLGPFDPWNFSGLFHPLTTKEVSEGACSRGWQAGIQPIKLSSRVIMIDRLTEKERERERQILQVKESDQRLPILVVLLGSDFKVPFGLY